MSLFKKVLKSDSKQLEFIAKRLRGAKDIFTHGGHVQSIYKDQKFRLLHDSRRQITEPENFVLSNKLLDSKPLLVGLYHSV